MTGREVVLLSVRSPHVERLLDGSKIVEFRRQRWSVPDGSVAVLYGAGQNRAIVGSVVVSRTEVASVDWMWRKHGKGSGLRFAEYKKYFAGADKAVAILVERARALDTPLTLRELRRRHPEFHVPQSYRRMPANELSVVLNGESRQLLGGCAGVT